MAWDTNLSPLLREHLREKFHEAEMWLALRDVLEARDKPPKPTPYVTMQNYNVFGFEQPDPLWSRAQDRPTPM